jgi:cytochrome c-type biogenesis protein CcmE
VVIWKVVVVVVVVGVVVVVVMCKVQNRVALIYVSSNPISVVVPCQ